MAKESNAVESFPNGGDSPELLGPDIDKQAPGGGEVVQVGEGQGDLPNR